MLKIVVFILAALGIAQAQDCADLQGVKFCIGDEVFNEYAENSEAYFGKIVGVKNNLRHILLNDNTVISDRYSGHLDLARTKFLPSCATFKNNKLCHNDKITVLKNERKSVLDEEDFGVLEIKAITNKKHSKDHSYYLYGATNFLDSFSDVSRKRKFLVNEGIVPGTQVKFDEKIPNVFGNTDMVKYSSLAKDLENTFFYVDLGGDKSSEIYELSKAQFDFRIKGSTSVNLNFNQKLTHYLETSSAKVGEKSLIAAAKREITSECKKKYFFQNNMNFDVTAINIKINGFSQKRVRNKDRYGNKRTQYRYSANINANFECRFQGLD